MCVLLKLSFIEIELVRPASNPSCRADWSALRTERRNGVADRPSLVKSGNAFLETANPAETSLKLDLRRGNPLGSKGSSRDKVLLINGMER